MTQAPHPTPKTEMPKTAMVFAAGLGTRMQPLTKVHPKPLIKVAGRPLIDYMLDLFAQNDLETAVVNVHYLADQIEAHLAHRKSPRIVISDERAKLLDQGGGIQKALPHLGTEPFFICNTDAFWIEGPLSNIKRLAQAWDPDRMDALLLVAPTATSIGVDWSGDFTMDPEGRLMRRAERIVAPFVYTGVGIIKPELFQDQTDDVFRLAPFLFDAANRGRLFGERLDGIWMHVGTPDAIKDAEEALETSNH